MHTIMDLRSEELEEVAMKKQKKESDEETSESDESGMVIVEKECCYRLHAGLQCHYWRRCSQLC